MAPPSSGLDLVESMGVPQQFDQPTWEWRELKGKSIKYDLTEPTKADPNMPHWTMVASSVFLTIYFLFQPDVYYGLLLFVSDPCKFD
jgi:hypothetical protein